MKKKNENVFYTIMEMLQTYNHVKLCLTWYSSPFPLPFLGFSIPPNHKFYLKFHYFTS